jgi:hypothetical protein
LSHPPLRYRIPSSNGACDPTSFESEPTLPAGWLTGTASLDAPRLRTRRRTYEPHPTFIEVYRQREATHLTTKRNSRQYVHRQGVAHSYVTYAYGAQQPLSWAVGKGPRVPSRSTGLILRVNGKPLGEAGWEGMASEERRHNQNFPDWRPCERPPHVSHLLLTSTSFVVWKCAFPPSFDLVYHLIVVM